MGKSFTRGVNISSLNISPISSFIFQESPAVIPEYSVRFLDQHFCTFFCIFFKMWGCADYSISSLTKSEQWPLDALCNSINVLMSLTSHFSFHSVCLGCLLKAVVLLRDRWLCQRK